MGVKLGILTLREERWVRESEKRMLGLGRNRC
jgi:hypothetical protein